MKYGLIAEKVGHSFSAEIHKKLFGYEYELKAISRDDLDAFMKSKDFLAVNVTIPYKEAVIPYLDYVNEIAAEIGAVNTVVNRDGKLYGYNTDILGITALIEKNNIVIRNKKVLILGSGGTSKTAFYAAKQLGANEIYRVSRNGREGCITYEDAILAHGDADVIINTTPVGMYPEIGNTPIDISCFPNLSGAVDAVYNPLRSKFICDCKEKGINAVGGLYMLVAQAAFAAEKFVGKQVPAQLIDNIYKEMFMSKQNIVLIGMPGSGKTAACRHIAQKLGVELYDTDNLIESETGRTPNEIIRESGEQAFRDIESQIVKKVSAYQGCVISTGGGAILRKENVELLRENGRIYFIDRPVKDIRVSDDRPLSSNRADVEKRYKERYEMYCSSCDVRFVPVDGAELNADIVLEDFYENSCD